MSTTQENTQPLSQVFRAGSMQSRRAISRCFFSYPDNKRYCNFIRKLQRTLREESPSPSKVRDILSDLEELFANPELSGTPPIEIWMANSIVWRGLSSVLTADQLRKLIDKLLSNEAIKTVLMDPRVLQIIEIEVGATFLPPPSQGKCLPDDVKQHIWEDYGLDLSWEPRSFSVDIPQGISTTENK